MFEARQFLNVIDLQNKISCRVIYNAFHHNNRESFPRDAIRRSATVDEGENGITRKRERYRVARKNSESRERARSSHDD